MQQRYNGGADPTRHEPALCSVAVPERAGQEQDDLDHAVNGLRRSHPALSAGMSTWLWQKWTLALLLPALAIAAMLAPEQAMFALAAVLVLPFFCVVALRVAALWHASFDRRAPAATERSSPEAQPLPRYSLLVPIYDEAAVVPDLVAALSAIDYPQDRMEVLLILETVDAKTRAAVAAERLPPHMRVVVVPDGNPRTKPRALNFALRRATGELVVVYDAEDVPEPNQLRRAASLLTTDPRLGCVQARLNVLNDRETWLTRQFAIEYTVLFDCMLPTLDRLNLPVPLGGTSNHFSGILAQEYLGPT